MAPIVPPLFQTVDGAYQGRHLGIPYRDLMSEGVVGATAMAVSQRGAGVNMSVDVAAGVAWIAGDDNTATQPLYRAYNDGVVNLAITTANAVNPRIDRVIAEVRDSAFSGVSQDWQLRVVAGTPAGSPVAPALPSNAISLALVSVPALDTTIDNAQITDTRPRAVVGGGAAVTPVCQLYRSSNLSIASSGSWTTVDWNAEFYDNDLMHDPVTNTSRITPRTPGFYLFHTSVAFDVNVTGTRYASIAKNGVSEAIATDGPIAAVSGDYSRCSALGFAYMNGTTDYAQVQVIQNSGVALNLRLDGSATAVRFTATLVGAV